MGPLSLQSIPQTARPNELFSRYLEQMPINVPPAGPGEAAGAGAMRPLGKTGDSFENVLGNMVREVNARQADAGEKMAGVLNGEGVPLHQAVIAMEEASVSFQLMVEVRNKMLESFQEIMRMQI